MKIRIFIAETLMVERKKLFTVYIHIEKMGCDTILEIKAKPSPEAVIISVPFAPEGKVKVSVN